MNNKLKNDKVYIYSMFALLFEILAIWFLFSRITYFSNFFSQNIVKFVFIILLTGFFAFTILIWDKIIKFCQIIIEAVKNSSYKKLLFLIVLVSLVTRIGLLFLLQIDSEHHPDCGRYWSFIRALTDVEKITENAEYATRYSYTVIYATFFLPFTKIFGASNIIYMNLYLCILFTVVSVLLYDTVNYYRGKNIAFAAILAWTIIPVGMVEPLLLVHENSFVILHSISIWLCFKILPSCKKWYYQIPVIICLALIITFASKINKFALISICAIIIISFIELIIKKFGIKSIITFVMIVLIFSGSYLGVSNVCDNYTNSIIAENEYSSQKKADYSIPYGWVLYVGLNYDSHGEWNAEDKEIYYKYENFDTKEEAREYQVNLIKGRLNDYKNNPKKLLKHLNHKMEKISYGFNPIDFDMGNNVNEFIVYGANGLIRKAMVGLFDLINIIVAFALAMTFKLKNNTDTKLESYLKLFMLGTCGVLIFTEVSPKYSSHLLFVYLIIAVMGYKTFVNRMTKIRNKIFKKEK